MLFDVLIIGAGVSGVSCAMVLGSGQKKVFAQDKKIGLIAHQKTSALQDAVFYNAYGVAAGTLGSDLLRDSLLQLHKTYPNVVQMPDEKVVAIVPVAGGYEVVTNKNSYVSSMVVVAVGSANTLNIKGLEEYIRPHRKALPEKQRIELYNDDHKVTDGLYVCGTLAGHRSQLAIAAGSGAAVATDVLVLWNDGVETHSHHSVREKNI